MGEIIWNSYIHLPCSLSPLLQYHLLHSMLQLIECLHLASQEELLNALFYYFVN